jgi:signal transduction histidine kinase
MSAFIRRPFVMALLGALVGGFALLVVIFGWQALSLVAPLLLFAAVGYWLLRFAQGPLARLIGRVRLSIRWKVLAVISSMALLVTVVSMINIGAMDHMHGELHDIQKLGPGRPVDVMVAVDALEAEQHGILGATPLFGLLAAPIILGLGIAVAWSIIGPVRRMEEAMKRIAGGDFSHNLEVRNRDELGDLAIRINDTARDLARLQDAALAAERGRALRERIAQVTVTQEEERRRISRELHDGLAPSLAAMGNRMRVCQQLVRREPARAEEELAEMARGLKQHIQEIRHLIYDLRPTTLDQLGLDEALRQLVARIRRETGSDVRFTSSGRVSLTPLAEVTVLRVVQECLSNVEQHAEASQVEVSIVVGGGEVVAIVEDDGRGFDVESTSALGLGVGLLSMRERAGLVGGNVEIESERGSGSRVTLRIPTTEATNGAHSSPARG